MSERIFEEVALVIKRKYTVRLLEYKEKGNEFTEISVYGKEMVEKDDELIDYFLFSFTVKGRGDEEKEKIEKMTEREFEEFIRHMTIFLEKKYNVIHKKEEKKEEKKEVKNEDNDDDDNYEDNKKEAKKEEDTLVNNKEFIVDNDEGFAELEEIP
jgi:hypothetical protein